MDIGAFELATNLALAGSTTIAEGSNGLTVPYTFTITRAGITSTSATIEYTLRGVGDNAARASDFADETMARAYVTFYPGEMSKTVTLNIASDSVVEGDQDFAIDLLSSSSEFFLSNSRLTVRILDDDYATLLFANQYSLEANALQFVATLSMGVEDGFSVDWKTVDQTAIASQDYMAALSTLDVIGLADETKWIDVSTISDQTVERDETLAIQLTAILRPEIANRVTVTTLALGTILNDDQTTLKVRGLSFQEGNSGTRQVTFDVTTGSKPVDIPFTAILSGAAQTASATTDFSASSVTLSFTGAPYQTQTYTVTIKGDTTVESDESFLINALNVAAGGRESSIFVTPASGLILNDDSPRIMVFSRGITETNTGQTAMLFDVALVKPQGHAATVTVSATSGTAIGGIDFQPTSQSLTFNGNGAANSIEVLPFSVIINADKMAELDESFNVILSNLQASGDAYTFANATGVIYNDDSALFKVDVPSLVAIDDPAQPQVIAATYNTTNLSLLDFKLGLIGGSDAPITGNLRVRAVGSTAVPVPKAITFTGDPNQKIPITLPANLANNDTQWLTISLTDINSNGRNTQGNQVWFIALRPSTDPNQQLCVGALPIALRNTGAHIYAPIPILVHIVEHAGPDGLLYGHWETADGIQVPGVGYYNGNIYTDNPLLIPNLLQAVIGDVGFGQDTFGYAIIPVMVLQQAYLKGSADLQNYGSVAAFNNARTS